MRKSLYILCLIIVLPFIGFSQCTTTNASSCTCKDGTTNCDLLPDIKVARPPLLVNGSSGYIEYPQVCNPSCNGNDGRLRLSVSTPNVGFGPLEVRTTPVAICGTDTFYNVASNFTCPNGQPLKQIINQRVYHKTGNTMTYQDRYAGTMTYHPSHGHMHVDEWGIYTLRSATSDPNPLNWPVIGTGSKLAFCLMDYGSCSTYNGHCTDSANNVLINSNFPNFGLGGGNYGCSPSVQGISSGYTDIYYQSLDGMWINLPPGLCNGSYWIVVQLDPYNYFLESNENNNVLAVPVTLTQQGGTLPAITASGSTSFCQGGSVTLTASPATNYLWSNGATTQSILVNQSGSYSVTINSGTSCVSTSNPTTVTVTALPLTAAANPTTVCPGQSVTLNASSSSSGTTNQVTAFSNTNAYAIPDNNSTGISSPVSVSGINPTTINSNTIVSVTVNITHTYTGDLQLQLISPSQNSIILSNRRGGSGDNYTNTVFTASATTLISSGSAPFTGSYRPEGSFTSLTGNVNGTWLLKVTDLSGNDVGTLLNWTLRINNVVPTTLTYNWSSQPAGFTATGPSVTASPTSNTTYNVTVVESGTGCQSSQSVSVTMNSSLNLNVTSATSVCPGGSATLSASGATSYSWYPATGLNTTSGSNVIASPSQTTTYGVIGTSGTCTDTANVTVTVGSAPSTPASISGPSNACIPMTGTYAVAPVNGASSYSWTVPPGVTLISGNGSTSISVSASGTVNGDICVSAVNSCGNSSTRCANLIVDGTAPASPTWLIGNAKACPGDVLTYQCSLVTGAATYNWSIPAGTTIISGQGTRNLSLQFNSGFSGGNLGVSAGNVCGNSAVFNKSLSINTPVTPGIIAGNGFGVCNKLETYSVNASTGMNYVWTAPSGATITGGQGTSTITVQFASSFSKGTLSVVAQNNCGTSTARTKSLKAAPDLPGTISGLTSVCKGQSGVAYSIAPVYGASAYGWLTPKNSSVVAGQGTTGITVNFASNAFSGDVKVNASNVCGSTLNQKLAITANTCQKISESGVNAGSGLSLYPNPATETVSVRFTSSTDGTAQININNIIGQELFSRKVLIESGANSMNIDLRKFPKGVYVVSLILDGKNSSRRLVIE